MTFVVVFNGQGEQRPEHVERLLRESTPDIAELLQAVLREQGVSLTSVTNEQLLANRVAQPLICAYQLALWGKLAPQLPQPALFAGYSLGELTAFACAGAIAAVVRPVFRIVPGADASCSVQEVIHRVADAMRPGVVTGQ